VKMSLRAHHWFAGLLLAVSFHAALGFALFYSPRPIEGARDKGAHGLEVSIQMVAAAVGAEAQEEVQKEPEPEPEPEPVTQVPEVKEPDPEPIDETAVETMVQPIPVQKVVQQRKPLIKPKPPALKPKPIKKHVKEQTEPVRKKIVAVKSSGTSRKAPLANRTDKQNQAGGGQIVGQVIPSYKTTLGRWLAQYKTYPKKARRRNQEGTVILQFTLNKEGIVTAHTIQKSSGHKSLDKETAKMLERAQPLPKIPSELGVNSLTLTLPIQFALR